MSFTQVTVIGAVKDPSQNPVVGAYVEFCLTGTIYTSDGTFVTASPQTAQTDANGEFSITLYATDDSETAPQGQVYRVEINVPSSANTAIYAPGSIFPVYYVALPASAAPTVDLAQLIATSPLPAYEGPTGPTGPGGGPTGPQGVTGPSGGATGPTGASGPPVSDFNTQGLSSAEIDALYPTTPPNDTILSDSVNNLLLVRQAGLWWHTAPLIEIP